MQHSNKSSCEKPTVHPCLIDRLICRVGSGGPDYEAALLSGLLSSPQKLINPIKQAIGREKDPVKLANLRRQLAALKKYNPRGFVR